MRPRALVIGFGPFPGVPVNPSAWLVRMLGRLRRPAFDNASIDTHILPTRYAAVEQELPMLIRDHKPDIVLMFGLAGRAKTMRIETQAFNARSSLHPDASGQKPLIGVIAPHSPARLASRAPLATLIAAARSAGINATVSHNPGRYICNASFFTCLDLRRLTGRPRLTVFVHIPWPRKLGRAGSRYHSALPRATQLLEAGAAMLAALITVARHG